MKPLFVALIFLALNPLAFAASVPPQEAGQQFLNQQQRQKAQEQQITPVAPDNRENGS